MRLYDVAYLYAVRLKARGVLVQEAFAVTGIAVGVALLFASQIAGASTSGSLQQLTGGVAGAAQYQLQARSPQGFDARLLARAQHLSGVRVAIPVLEQQVGLIGTGGRSRAVDLVATEPRYIALAGPLLRHFSARQLEGQRALALPAPIARAIGANAPLEVIGAQVDGRLKRTLVASILGSSEIGALVNSPVALAPLRYAQELTGMRGRITRVLVRVDPGQLQVALVGLRRLAAGRLNVEPVDHDAALFAQASSTIVQSTDTFAGICALVGFMFAYCSILLAATHRQRLIAELRLAGATRRQIVRALLFDAFLLGALGSLVGLVLGDLLSLLVFSAGPEFLSSAFPVGTQRIVSLRSAATALAVGLLAAGVGVLVPLRHEISSSSRAPRAARRPPSAVRWRAAAALGGGLVCGAGAIVVLLAAPGAAVLGVALLVAALMLLLPRLILALIGAYGRLQGRFAHASPALAVLELRSPLTRARSLAIASTAAIAVFGGITIGGSRANLQAGLYRAVHAVASVADIWVVSSGTLGQFNTIPIRGLSGETLARLPGVRAVGSYRAGFLDVGDRRVWAIAPPATAVHPVAADQLVDGDLATATARLRAGGWAVLSRALAAQLRVGVGQRFTLPAPRPTTLRVAALSTNNGWPAGFIVLGSSDFVRAWGEVSATAFNVMLAPGASRAAVEAELRRTLAHAGYGGLAVLGTPGREREQRAIADQGLARLEQIALLVLIAGVLAAATSMGGVISERRHQCARLKIQGYRHRTLWLALVWETLLLLGTGCLVGAAFGILGQLMLSHALLAFTNFPVTFSAKVPAALESLATVTLAATAIIAIHGYRVAGARAAP